jgi:hypothetical protein
VLAEAEHDPPRLVPVEPIGDVHLDERRVEFGGRGRQRVPPHLSVEHLGGRPRVGGRRVGAVVLPAEVLADGAGQGPRLQPAVEGQDVDHLPPGHPEGNAHTGELGGQQRQVERRDPEAGQVAPVQGGEQLGGDRGERRGAGHVGIGDAVDRGRSRWNRDARVDSAVERLRRAARQERQHRHLDHPIQSGIDAGRFQINYGQGPVEYQVR